MKVSEQLIELYTKATEWAMKENQVVGENNDYYITLWELQSLIGVIVNKEELS